MTIYEVRISATFSPSYFKKRSPVQSVCMAYILIGATIYTGKDILKDHVLVIEGSNIQAISGDKDAFSAEAVDCTDCIIAPGLIDLQIYGGGGVLFSDNPTPEALKAMADHIVQTGTTGFFVTLATNSMDIFRKAMQVVRENPHPAVLGLHFEGPYINPEKRGAHILQYIKKPQKEEVARLLQEAQGVLKMMTLAPEMCDPAVIHLLRDHGVVVSAGHSNATFEEAVKGYENGITTTTHLFNAMSPFHHRNTGLPGAAFLTPWVYSSIIPDGIHVDYHALIVARKMMGERLFLITDAVEETLSGAYIHVRKKDRFTLPDGTLSGSALTLLKGVQNCVAHAGIPLDEALRMASAYPARVIQADHLGQIEKGLPANLVIFNRDFTVKYVVLNGKMITPEKITP